LSIVGNPGCAEEIVFVCALHSFAVSAWVYDLVAWTEFYILRVGVYTIYACPNTVYSTEYIYTRV